MYTCYLQFSLSKSVPSSDPGDEKDSHRDSGILVPEANILGPKEDGEESLLLKDVQTLRYIMYI